MENTSGPKVDKAFFSSLFAQAKAALLDNGNSLNHRYLEGQESVARAYYEATLAMLHQKGFEIVPRAKKPDPK